MTQSSLGIAKGSEELIHTMKDLQYFTHKAGLSLNAKNLPLAEFYAHEMEEVIEGLEKIKQYDGKPVGSLIKSLLGPSFKEFETQVKKRELKSAQKAFNNIISSCNNCHRVSDKGAIKIVNTPHNPYMQSFTP